jgi:hypothetical protein
MMQCYIVRLKDMPDEPHKPFELVGIWCCLLRDLAYCVDECAPPVICEFAVLGFGGIFWPNGGAVCVPAWSEEKEEGPDPFKDETGFAGNWTALIDGDGLTWKDVGSE